MERWRTLAGDRSHSFIVGEISDGGGEGFYPVQCGYYPGLPFKVEGKIFLNQLLRLTSAEISLHQLPPKKSIPFYHKHRLNEEVYLFISGEGEFQVDGVSFPVKEGTVVRVDPGGERCIRNCSETSGLHWIVIQAQANSYTNHPIEDGVGVQKRVSWVKKN